MPTLSTKTEKLRKIACGVGWSEIVHISEFLKPAHSFQQVSIRFKSSFMRNRQMWPPMCVAHVLYSKNRRGLKNPKISL